MPAATTGCARWIEVARIGSPGRLAPTYSPAPSRGNPLRAPADDRVRWGSIIDGAAHGTTGGSVRFLPADVSISVRAGESIVDAVRRQGYRTRYSCRRGGCGACKADLVTGEVTYRVPVADSVLSGTERAEGKCLPCQAAPVGDVVIRLGAKDRLRRPFAFLDPNDG